ncbi:hypothetical protein [Aneurinibacillus aneurinilyticus]|jgi:hypothetical protein|uniref:Flagellar hook-length control protein FliK n=1 Tax=Aneurinibacillus aneurinilyticus TaxID=1391 RepID=A0A848CVF4_ANEAE|nr:hypothetical protein [Aneurinibacillus aneurinilyticus]NME97210.1 hypothetical protein [Aneurinibacillus aneurinilyticus]
MIQGFMTSQILQQFNNRQASLIELMPGQVFQGKVLKLFPDNLATVQLGGLTVTARLETPLELGQRTWLQVQPGGQPVTLRVINQPGQPDQASEASMEGLAKALGAPITKESLSLLNKAVDAGIPLRAESLHAFERVVAEVGTDPSIEDAMILAAKKGFPLTKETVLALRAFAGNASLEGEMDKLSRLAQQARVQAEGLPVDIKERLHQLVARIEGVRDGLAQVKNSFVSPSPSISASQMEEPPSKSPLQKQNLPASGIKQAIVDLFDRLGLNHEKALGLIGGEKAVTTEAENIKSTLLHLLQHPKAEVLPAPLREQMQQFVQQVTGQQLMMAGPAGDNAFVQVAIQLPAPGQENGENTLIQIESRKKGRGELDPDNCRMFFYLSMRNIGETMLDVSIVNKILSVTIYNNQEGFGDLVRALRASLERSLSEQGYRLSGLRVLAVPENKGGESSTAVSSLSLPPSSVAYYKGVDFRV